MFVVVLMVTFVVFFPASSRLSPVITVIFPAVGNPAVARARCLPVTWDPFVPGASPVPEAVYPDMPDYRRRSDILNARRRRGYHAAIKERISLADDFKFAYPAQLAARTIRSRNIGF
jgi:hypothetical protein